MEIRGKEYNNWNLFELDGSLDLHSVHDLKNLFKQLRDQERNVVLDFKNVRKVDSSGIGCLIFCQKILNASDKSLRIVNLSDRVRIVFQITRGFEIFEIYDELKFAVESYDINKDKQAA